MAHSIRISQNKFKIKLKLIINYISKVTVLIDLKLSFTAQNIQCTFGEDWIDVEDSLLTVANLIVDDVNQFLGFFVENVEETVQDLKVKCWRQ